MTILENSPLQNNNWRVPLNSGIEPKLYFTDPANELYFIIVKNTGPDEYKVVYSGKLKGYNNNYRFDFSKYIDIIQHIEPVFENITNNYNQKFVNNNRTQLTFICYVNNIFTSYPNKFTIEDNGEITFNGDPVDFIGEEAVEGMNYTFFNKEDITSNNIGLPDSIYSKSFVPSTVSPTFDYPTGEWVGMNLIVDGEAVRDNESFNTGFDVVYDSDLIHLTPGVYKLAMDMAINPTGWNVEDSFMFYGEKRNGLQYTEYYNPTLCTIINGAYNRYTTTLTVTTEGDVEVYAVLINNSPTQTYSTGQVHVKNIKLERATVATPFTPSVSEYQLSLMCFDDNNIMLNKLNTNNDGNIIDYLTYIPESTTKIYCHSNNKKGFFNVQPQKCNLHNWYYYSNNGNLCLSYTDANVHEIENTQKEYLTIGSKEYTTKVITTKQKKINTGYGLNESEMYEVIKTPYIYEPVVDEIEYDGLNLLLNSDNLAGQWRMNPGQGVIDTTTIPNKVSLANIREDEEPCYFWTYSVNAKLELNKDFMFSFDLLGTTPITLYLGYGIELGTFNANSDTVPLRVKIKINTSTFVVPAVIYFMINNQSWSNVLCNFKLEKGDTATNYTVNPLESNEDWGLFSTKRYKQLNSTFEGFNGSLLSEKNIEMVIEDERKYEKKSNIKLNFFD